MPRKFNYKSKIRSAVRRIWSWSPMHAEAIRTATIIRGYADCAKCKKRMKKSIKPPLYAVDHIDPASEPSALIHDWNSFLERLFCPASQLQILCRECHAEKTQKENEKRKSVKLLGKLPRT